MAYKRYGLAGQIIPFWKREIEALPKWQAGDPQIRMFLPTFWMKIVKPPPNTPKNQVYFVTHPQMTRFDVKNYLESIYKVPVASVRTHVKLTQQKIPGLSTREELLMSDAKPKHPVRDKKQIAKRYSEEYKEAIVTLGEGETFEFPDFESKIPITEDIAQFEEMKKKMEESKRDDRMPSIPKWFR